MVSWREPDVRHVGAGLGSELTLATSWRWSLLSCLRRKHSSFTSFPHSFAPNYCRGPSGISYCSFTSDLSILDARTTPCPHSKRNEDGRLEYHPDARGSLRWVHFFELRTCLQFASISMTCSQPSGWPVLLLWNRYSQILSCKCGLRSAASTAWKTYVRALFVMSTHACEQNRTPR